MEVDLPADLPLVRVDAMLIEQVLANLLENAAKYTPPGTPIDGAREQHGSASWSVSVEDRGPGLPPGDEQLFDKFYRGRRRRARRRRPRAHHLPRHRRGCMAAASGPSAAPGGGAAFRFTLPHRARPRPMPAGRSRVSEPRATHPGHRGRAARSAASCAPSLGAEGYRVVEAETGSGASSTPARTSPIS